MNQPKYKFSEQFQETVDVIKYFPVDKHIEVIQPNGGQSNSKIVSDDLTCDKQNNI